MRFLESVGWIGLDVIGPFTVREKTPPVRKRQNRTQRYLEIALVTVSLLNRCSYCVSHHAPKLEVEGISAHGTETLLEYAAHPELDDIDRLVVEYSIAVNDNWTRTGEAIFERLRAHFTDAQIVELTWRIALCGAFNRFSDILQLEVEDGLAGQQAAE